MSKRLVVHPDQVEAVIAEAKARGWKVTYPPRTPDELFEQMRPNVENRQWATKLRFVEIDGALGEMWQDCQVAFVVGLDVAALSLGVAIIEGLLRAAIYRVCESPSVGEAGVDTALEDKLAALTLWPLTEKARKLGLISETDEKFIKEKVAPLRNPTQHGNTQQLVRDLLGYDYEFPVEQTDPKMSTPPTPTTVKAADAKWINGTALRAISNNLAPELVNLCCMMSQHLDAVIRDIPKDRLPLPW